jgi:hypothetical protein
MRSISVILNILTQAGIFSLLSIVVALVPIGMGILYAVRPTEGRLALMRPLSLAGLFAGLAGLLSGLMNGLMHVSMSPGIPPERLALWVSESLVPLFIAFGSLTVGWLCVALGMTRRP